MLAVIVAFAIKLALVLATYGTNDVLFWEADIRKIQTDGGLALYRDGAVPRWEDTEYRAERFNQPPFMMHACRAGGAVADASGVPFRVWLRVTGALADIGTFLLVWGILRAERLALNPPMLLAVALSPVSILVSGFHGNTDPIMICFLLLSIYLIASRRSVWLAGTALGMAMNIKVVPIIFLPAILLYLTSLRSRVAFALSAGAVFLAGSMPYLAQEPALVIRNVFGYNPVAGLWGFPLIARLVSAEALAGYLIIGKYLALGAVLLASIWIYIRAPRCPLFLRCGFVAFLFLFLASGFGTQYLVWLVPWSAALPWRSVRCNYALMGADVFLYYGAYSRWGWYMANTMGYPPLSIVWVGMLQTACWISVGAVTVAYGRQALKVR